MHLIGWTLRKMDYKGVGIMVEAHDLSGSEGIALSVFKTEQEAEKYRATLRFAARYKPIKVFVEE